MKEPLEILRNRKMLKELIIDSNKLIYKITELIITIDKNQNEEQITELIKFRNILTKKQEILQYYHNECREEIKQNNITIKSIDDLIKYGIF